MHVCSYSLDCKKYKIDFIDRNININPPYKLVKTQEEVYSLYPLQDALDFYLKLSLTQERYHQQMHFLHQELIIVGIIMLIITCLLAIIFSFYALYPLRNSLLLTREFIKDILHDVNTPIATMRLNLSLLQKEIGSNTKVQRIERSIENILGLEENLRQYLEFEASQKEKFVLFDCIEERVDMIESHYPSLFYSINIPKNIILYSFKKDFIRIVDNIIINASKYNKHKGKVIIDYHSGKSTLFIEDTGKGIQYPQKVFRRFYKEHERGLGLGLHIVEKLSKILGIVVKIESILGEKTIVSIKVESLKI